MKMHKFIGSSLLVLLLLWGCSKDFEGLIRDSFGVSLDIENQPEGFIFQDLGTSISISASKQLSDAVYFLDYTIIEGDGYFRDLDGERISPGERQLESTSFSYGYVPTDVGVHKILFKVRDGSGNRIEGEAAYEVRYAPFTALLQDGTNNYVVNRKNDLLLILLSENTSKELDTTYRVRYSVEGGIGTLFRDTTALEVGREFALGKGNSNVSYRPTTLGDHVISLICTSPDGHEKTLTHSLEVKNTGFFVSAEPSLGQATVGEDLPISVLLESADSGDMPTYGITYYFDQSSEGVGTLTGPNGEPLAEGVKYGIAPGRHIYTFNSNVAGQKRLYFDISDSNNQILRDTVSFNYLERGFDLRVSTANTDVSLNQTVPILFRVETEGEIAGYSLSYTAESGNGELRDGEGNLLSIGSQIQLGEKVFSLTYTPTTLGDNHLLFRLTDPFGNHTEMPLEFSVSGDNAFFGIASSKNTYELTQNADITFNNGGRDYFTVTYSTTRQGIITYKGTSYPPGSSFLVGPGTSLASYQAFETGGHSLDFDMGSVGGLSLSGALAFEFLEELGVDVSIRSNIGGSVPEVGSGVEVSFSVPDGTYSAIFNTSGQGTFSYNGVTVANNGNFELLEGESVGSYTGNGPGEHELSFTFTSALGDTQTGIVSVGYVDPSAIASGTTGPKVTIGGSGTHQLGTGVAVDFGGLGTGTYTVRFESSADATFQYNGLTYAPGDSFQVTAGSPSGIYTGNESGNHGVSFEFISENGQTSVSSVSINYQGNTTVDGFTAEALVDGAVSLRSESSIALNLSGPGSFTATYSTDNVGTLIYNGVELFPGDSFPVDKGASVAIYKGTEPGAHTIMFSLVSDQGVSYGQSVVIQYDGSADDQKFKVRGKGLRKVLNEGSEITLDLEGNVDHVARFSTTGDGYFLYQDTYISEGETFPLLTGESTGYFVGTSSGVHTVEFEASQYSDFFTSYSDQTRFVYAAIRDFEFTVEERTNDVAIGEDIVLDFNIDQSQEVFFAKFLTDNQGVFSYKGAELESGDIFRIDNGTSQGSYNSSQAGPHNARFILVSGNDIYAYGQTRLNYVAGSDAINFLVNAVGRPDQVGDTVEIRFTLRGNGNYSATYTNSGTGTLTYNGNTIAPGEEFPVSTGNSSAFYTGTSPGNHGLAFRVTDGSGIETTKSINLEY